MAATDSLVVVITGASAGVGRATAQTFARKGAKIGLLARGRDGLEGARSDVERLGGRALVVPTDVSDPDQVEAAASAVEGEFGPITVWINDAMVSVFSPIRELRAEEIRRVTEVTYLGAVYGSMAALRRMLPRDEGVIVQVGSALAYRSIPLQAAYCAAKHALLGFTMALRCELLHERSRVRVTMVQMPALNTPQFEWSRSRMPRKAQPVPPIYQPEVAAEAILFAARHPGRRERLVGGSTLKAVEANKMAGGLLDRYLGRTGYAAQQTDEPEDPNRPDNLFQPLPGDRGAHGPFDSRSRSFSRQWWLSRHAAALAAAGLGLGALLWKARRAREARPARRPPLPRAA